ncbi:unnamed protein product [Dicrocoelium dendriticum]|nr:unnamed protein product [Dicrocoelium dendriticum]
MPTSSEPPTTQSNGGLNWLVAESGFLSPRNRRSVVSPPNAPSTPGKSLTTRTTRQTVVNHPLPQTSSVSAKVTLQSLGLALDDFVCIGPGCTTDSINPDGSSAAVTIGSRIGRLRYCGPVEFASGIWVGVELEKPLGRNNGSVSGVQYFNCAPSHGLFAPIGRVYKAVNEGSSQMWHPVHQSKRPPSAPRSRPPTPKQEHPGVTATSGTGDTSPRCFVPNSRSSYSLSSCPDSSQPRVTSPTNHPIDVSHVTAKVDTGLRTHSADKNGAPQLEIGNRVLVAGQRKGILRFIGPTQFAPGTWYGVELDQPLGKNNGSVSGVRYFQCPIGHGIFASRERIQRLPDRPSKSRDSPSALLKHHSSMSESFHGGEPDRRITTHGPSHRMAWSTTTSPMIGRAVVGRPTLPAELLKVLQNAVTRSEQVHRASQEPAFYITEGMQVLCAGEIGTVRYIGPITFADGIWLGVELRKPRGRHDGSVAGKRYFHCRPGHGLLVRPSRVSCRGINAVNLLPPALAAMEQELMAKRQTPTEKRSQSDVASSDVSSVVASSSSSRRSSYKHSPT